MITKTNIRRTIKRMSLVSLVVLVTTLLTGCKEYLYASAIVVLLPEVIMGIVIVVFIIAALIVAIFNIFSE